MDRFNWHKPVGASQSLAIAEGVCLYDGEERSAFESGTLQLYPTLLVWTDAEDPNCSLSVALSLILGVEEKSRSFMRSAKIMLTLSATPASDRDNGPVSSSFYNSVMLSFRKGGEEGFMRSLKLTLSEKAWEKLNLPNRKTRAGIVGIERKYREEQTRTNRDIQAAFEDLRRLMGMAKDMVGLAQSISEKIRAKQGDITEDETIKFKSYLLSLGIQDPVTRDEYGSGDRYYTELARQLASVLEEPIRESAGMMSLTDAYCRINRARWFDLLSPDDLLISAKLFNSLNLPVRLHQFDSGVMVLMLSGESVEGKMEETEEAVTRQGSLSSEELAQMLGIPVLLAKERLLAAETAAMLCRDETVEGLRFFPNLFMTRG